MNAVKSRMGFFFFVYSRKVVRGQRAILQPERSRDRAGLRAGHAPNGRHRFDVRHAPGRTAAGNAARPGARRQRQRRLRGRHQSVPHRQVPPRSVASSRPRSKTVIAELGLPYWNGLSHWTNGEQEKEKINSNRYVKSPNSININANKGSCFNSVLV